jgi:hypothetical protein
MVKRKERTYRTMLLPARSQQEWRCLRLRASLSANKGAFEREEALRGSRMGVET